MYIACTRFANSLLDIFLKETNHLAGDKNYTLYRSYQYDVRTGGNPWNRFALEKLVVTQQANNFAASYGVLTFLTIIATVVYWILI
jgi:hypothetical protein